MNQEDRREYAQLAVNLKIGCEHGCRYCYGPSAFHKTRESFHSNARTREQALEKLARDAKILRDNGDDREIFLSFATAPYGPDEVETKLTRHALEILIVNGLRFTVLTKGGTRAGRDFDLLAAYDKCSFGTMLVFASKRMRTIGSRTLLLSLTGLRRSKPPMRGEFRAGSVWNR